MNTTELARLLRLIVITDEDLARRHGHGDRSGVEVVVTRALDAGCRAIQLRMKNAGAGEMLEAARILRRMTAEAGALLFVNDRLDVALAAGADGVHLGPDDIPVAAARKAVARAVRRGGGGPGVPGTAGGAGEQGHAGQERGAGEGGGAAGPRTAADRFPPFLIGYSTDDPVEARRAVADGADYIGCGTVYPTGSKKDAGSVIGVDGLEAVARAVDVPVVAIGGIGIERVDAVARTHAAGVAVISAVMGAEEPGEAARELLEAFRAS